MCGLTFELTGPERQAGLARLATMYRMAPTGPSWPAAEGPVQRGVRPQCRFAQVLAHGKAMATSFMRAPAPDLIVTADLDTLKCLATRAMSSVFAFPSTGGDLSVAEKEPSLSSSSVLSRLLGLTLT